MTNQLGRRALAGAASLLPAAALIGGAGIQSAFAQGAPESTFDRVRRTKTLRIAALPGELPYFQKDLATGEWSGACDLMAKDIAKVFDAQLAYVEFTYGNSVLDLQSNKVDLAFALNPSPARALSVGFTHPMIVHPFGCLARKDLDPKTWGDIDKPDLKVAFDIGSLHEVVARRYCAQGAVDRLHNRDEWCWRCNRAMPTCIVQAALIGPDHRRAQSEPRAVSICWQPDRRAAHRSRGSARARHPFRRGDQRLARLQSRHRPDPRMDAARSGATACRATRCRRS